LTTLLRRLVVPVLVFGVWTPVAQAWSWPVQGPVLQPFVFDESHPYASGQHRGIDIGADAAGETVAAPAAGTVSFAGSVPTSGKSVTIETSDGYSVTLTHLGSIVVAKGAAVAEGEAVGTVGPSGTPEEDGPYLHLGIRLAADPNGYVDPLSLLPPVAEAGATESGSTATQPSAGSGSSSSTAPASQPAPAVSAGTPAAAPQGSTVRTSRAHISQPGGSRAQAPQPQRSSEPRPVSRPAVTVLQRQHRVRPPHLREREPVRSSRRPVVETAAPREPTGLGAGHESRSSVRVRQLEPEQPQASADLLALVLNGAAALVGLAAALAAARRRVRTQPTAGAQILHLPRPACERRRAA
jgi:Peptidase family M23